MVGQICPPPTVWLELIIALQCVEAEKNLNRLKSLAIFLKKRVFYKVQVKFLQIEFMTII